MLKTDGDWGGPRSESERSDRGGVFENRDVGVGDSVLDERTRFGRGIGRDLADSEQNLVARDKEGSGVARESDQVVIVWIA